MGRGAFQPPPAVDSAVVRLVPHAADPFPLPDPDRFARVVAAAFSMRRKTLRNSLRGLVDAAGFAAAGVDAEPRARRRWPRPSSRASRRYNGRAMSHYRRILLVVDLGEQSERIGARARDLAALMGAELSAAARRRVRAGRADGRDAAARGADRGGTRAPRDREACRVRGQARHRPRPGARSPPATSRPRSCAPRRSRSPTSSCSAAASAAARRSSSISPKTPCCTPRPATCWPCGCRRRRMTRPPTTSCRSTSTRATSRTSRIPDEKPLRVRLHDHHPQPRDGARQAPRPPLAHHRRERQGAGGPRRGRRRRAAAPDAGPGFPLHERRRARDAGRLDAGRLPDARGRRRAIRSADRRRSRSRSPARSTERAAWRTTRSATCRAATRNSWRCSSGCASTRAATGSGSPATSSIAAPPRSPCCAR